MVKRQQQASAQPEKPWMTGHSGLDKILAGYYEGMAETERRERIVSKRKATMKNRPKPDMAKIASKPQHL